MKKFSFSRLASALAASAMILMAAFSGCSSSSSGSGGGDEEEEKKQEEEAGKTGTVSIKVAVDDSENPTYTVIFKDATEDGYTSNESVTETVEYGDTVVAPAWTRDGYNLSWNSSVDGLTVKSDITADVTFTAVWTKIVYYSVTFHDSDGTNADDVQQIESGKTATVPSWTKDGFTLTWTSSVSGLAPASSITADVTFTTVWTEKPKCSNCGTHYDTQAEADACSKQSGCPKFEAVAAGTYDLTSSGIFTKQSAGKTQTASGITVTCTIDSKGANLKTGSGSIAFAIASDMTLTFTDSNSKGVVIKTTGGYIGTSGTTTSETLKSATALKLGAGSYTIEGATKSSAKIASLTFAAVSE